jgi:hypothetical protein
MGVVVKKETARQTDTSKADWKSAVLAGWLAGWLTRRLWCGRSEGGMCQGRSREQE